MATYDHLLLAFDMDRRPAEAKMLWNMILHAHDRSISKRLFSRMISLYDHHNMSNNVIEVIVPPFPPVIKVFFLSALAAIFPCEANQSCADLFSGYKISGIC